MSRRRDRRINRRTFQHMRRPTLRRRSTLQVRARRPIHPPLLRPRRVQVPTNPPPFRPPRVPPSILPPPSPPQSILRPTPQLLQPICLRLLTKNNNCGIVSRLPYNMSHSSFLSNAHPSSSSSQTNSRPPPPGGLRTLAATRRHLLHSLRCMNLLDHVREVDHVRAGFFLLVHGDPAFKGQRFPG